MIPAAADGDYAGGKHPEKRAPKGAFDRPAILTRGGGWMDDTRGLLQCLQMYIMQMYTMQMHLL
jgi:hypothetical protein